MSKTPHTATLPSKRLWLRSKYDQSLIYVDQASVTKCDGMPAIEANLLASIVKRGPRYDLRIYLPSTELFPGFETLQEAKAAAEQHLRTSHHENGAIR